MAARALRPVQAITRAAAEIGEGDLSRRLNLDVADEPGELASLVENAVKDTGGAGTQVRVSVGACDEDAPARASVRVEDDGPGIASEHLSRIFDRFYRGDRVRCSAVTERAPPDDGIGPDEPRGSGLGLAIGRWIARAHGGDIRVSSVFGRGSVFEVWLPLAAAAETPLTHPTPQARSERRQPVGTR
ncbi:MAG TPA: ATP-binding protein [Chloroflexota bacterium]|nr:ATP-binding protein [Chloroflexota bacterium]